MKTVTKMLLCIANSAAFGIGCGLAVMHLMVGNIGMGLIVAALSAWALWEAAELLHDLDQE